MLREILKQWPWRGWPFGRAVTAFSAIALVLVPLGCRALQSVDPHIHRENGPLENLQAGLLLAGGILLLGRMARRKSGGDRALLAGLALLCFNFAALEIDLRHSAIPAVAALTRGWARNSVLAAAWGVVFLFGLRHRIEAWRRFQEWSSGRGGVAFIVSGVFWVTATLIDAVKPFASEVDNFMAEEVVEVDAAFLMLAAAWLTTRGD